MGLGLADAGRGLGVGFRNALGLGVLRGGRGLTFVLGGRGETEFPLVAEGLSYLLDPNGMALPFL